MARGKGGGGKRGQAAAADDEMRDALASNNFGISSLLRPDKFPGTATAWKNFKLEVISFFELTKVEIADALARIRVKMDLQR